MTKRFQFKSIQMNILTGILAVVVIILLLTTLLSYRFTKQTVEKSSKEYTLQLIEQVENNIEYYLKDMDNIANAVAYNFDVSEYFSGNLIYNEDQKNLMKTRIELEIKGMLEHRRDISTISIFGFNGTNILSGNKNLNAHTDIYEENWFEEAIESSGQSIISSSHVQNIYENEYPWVVSLSKRLVSIKDKRSIGVLLIDLNYEIINEICSDIRLGEHGYIYILDESGDLVYHPQQRLINSKLRHEVIDDILPIDNGSITLTNDGEEKIYTVKTSEYSGWKIIGVTYGSELISNNSVLPLYYFTLSLIALIIAILSSSWIAQTISKPIKELKASMIAVRNRDLDVEVIIDNANEIGDLSQTFNDMTQEIKTLIKQKTDEQRLKRKSELKALQAQINPHFLYNTLDSIIWMSVENKNEDVIEMTSALAKMFRSSISKGKELISIGSEMEHVKNYLIIQKYRYGDKIDFEVTYDESIKGVKVLKLMLQPIVENSIYHGLKNNVDGGKIEISAYRDDQHVVFKIIDNGVGMSQWQVENILTLESDSGNGVGVRNVDERIKLYFGESYGLNYESEIDEGTTVSIRLPIVEWVE